MSTELVPTRKEKSNGSLAKNKDTPKTMKGLVYNWPGKIEWKEVPKPGMDKQTYPLVSSARSNCQ